jgi:hypothetical protein
MPDGFSVSLAGVVRIDHLGPAQVTGVLASEIEVACGGAHRLARLAVPAFYQPCVGDTVLVIASSDDVYVIGVLEASGPMTLRAPGDLRFCAPHGTIALDAAEIDMTGGEMRVQTNTLVVMARHLRESFEGVRRIVRGTLDLEVGDLRTTVRDMFAVVARRLCAVAEDDVKIDGKHIHLG